MIGEKKICPLTGKTCDENCAWYIKNNPHQCSITIIAAKIKDQ